MGGKMQELITIQKRLLNEKASRDALLITNRELEKNLDAKLQRCSDAKEARVLLQKVARITQSSIEYHISNIVSSALLSVFGPDAYEFKARFEERRNKTECDLLFIRNEEELDPMEDSEGGALDIASFALRIAIWCIKKTAPIFFLDEPGKHTSAIYQDKSSQMVKMISEKLGIQFIIITHQLLMAEYADTVFKLNKGEIQ